MLIREHYYNGVTNMKHPVIYEREQFLAWLQERYGRDFAPVADELPPLIHRTRYDELAKRLDLPLCARSLANLDSRGEGPGRYL